MARPEDTPVAILCGGRGTRLQERTHAIPKALVEIGGRPIVWHVIQLYITQGFREVVLLTGHLGEQVAAFADAERWPADVRVTCLDTGSDTPTGGRVARAAAQLGERTTCVTYADGVADIDLAALRDHHAGSGGLATVTVVRPRLPFGVARLEGDRVAGFEEKRRAEHWINGGFFAFEPGALQYLREDSVLEREPLERLAGDGRLVAFRHGGFWACMDTYKDAIELDDLWRDGAAPWRKW
jgi:glucose-1-phosphate cytidylyltransferase